MRLNGEFRIYTILCFIIIACIELDKYLQQTNDTTFSTAHNQTAFNGNIKWIYYTIEILLFFFIFFGSYKAIAGKQSFLFANNNIFSTSSFSLKLKSFIDSITFYDAFWIQGIIQLLFLWGIKWCLKYKNWNLLKNLAVINMAVACLMNVPYTGAGKMSVAKIQSIINQSPQGIPIPPLKPIKDNDTLALNEVSPVGDWSFYNKQIGVKSAAFYPVALKNMKLYFDKNETNQSDNFLNQPFIFISPTHKNNELHITSYSPNKISITAKTDTLSKITLQQNFYPHWFYENGDKKKEVDPEGINFMSAPLQKGESHTTFSFEPTFVKWMMLISAVSFMMILISIIALKKGSKE